MRLAEVEVDKGGAVQPRPISSAFANPRATAANNDVVTVFRASSSLTNSDRVTRPVVARGRKLSKNVLESARVTAGFSEASSSAL